MGATSTIIGWIGLGIVTGLVGMMLPYHRGYRGVMHNVLLGVLGAVGAGLLGRFIGLYLRLSDPMSFLVATLGGVAVVGIYHAVWTYRRSHDQMAA